MASAILYDASKCTACRGCQVACKNWNEREAEQTQNTGTYENPPDLSHKTWLKMEFREYADAENQVQWVFNRRACMHCVDPACVKVCPTGALYIRTDGFVSIDKGKCSNCGYCVEFCPFEVPRLDVNRVTGLGDRITKCTACTTPGLNRLDNGDIPACVKTCPTGALAYGDRGTLLRAAAARLAELQNNGSPNATLYGKDEFDGQGTNVIYILERDPKDYGLPVDPQVAGTASAWQDVIKPLGYAAAGIVGLGLILNIMVARARIISEKEGK
jgi:formate dehydrogenase iron-sulfur subunit